MADTTTKEAKISIKVFVDKVNKRVVYAEADHTFVDILFSFMTLPLGTIVRILEKHDDDKKFEALGSLNNLYQSLKNFPERYLSSEECKFMLLNPRSVSYDYCRNLKLRLEDTEPIKYFTCPNHSTNEWYFSICSWAKCTICGTLMNYDCFVDSKVCVGGGVFVSDIATFIVTDSFFVMPYTLESCFQLFIDLGITDTSYLEERNIDLDSQQMLYLLKLALSLNSPLTHFVFHKNDRNLNVVTHGQITTFDRCDSIKKEVPTSSKMILKVSLQKSTRKLLFAESNGDFVDFLFCFLSIPLGTVIGTLMNGASSLSCMDNIFKSISTMSVGLYLKSQDIKDMLVKPQFGQEYSSKNLLFPIKSTTKTERWLGVPFPRNHLLKDPRMNKGLLKPSGMFFVTDDLFITPSSSHLAIKTMNTLKVLFDDVEKYEISIGLEEGLRMLKESLLSKSTLMNSLEHHLKK